MMKSIASLMPRAFTHSQPENKLDSRVLSRVAMPGFHSKMSKSHFPEWRLFFFLFQPWLFLVDELCKRRLNFWRNLFFLRRFQEADSLRGDLWFSADFFRDEWWMDVFRFFRDEHFFFWDRLFLQRCEFRFSHFFFHPVPKRRIFRWSLWRLLFMQLPENSGFIWGDVIFVLHSVRQRFSLWWDGDWSDDAFWSDVTTFSVVKVQ